MPDDTKYTPYESLEELLDDWLADNPESSMQRVQAEMRRSLERLKAALEKQRGHSLSKQEFKTLVAKRQQLRKSPNSPQAFDEWTKELERESNKMMAGLRALSGRPPKRKPSIEAIKFPATATPIFSCEQCDKGFPLEDGVRVLLSAEQADQFIAEFSKTVEPRTIVCSSCGHEAEYYPEDVALFVLPEK